MATERLQVALLVFKALADESRLRIIGVLASGERSVEELTAVLQVKAPTISHHLNKLKEAGLVRMRAEGTAHVYHADTATLPRELIADAHGLMRRERGVYWRLT